MLQSVLDIFEELFLAAPYISEKGMHGSAAASLVVAFNHDLLVHIQECLPNSLSMLSKHIWMYLRFLCNCSADLSPLQFSIQCNICSHAALPSGDLVQ